MLYGMGKCKSCIGLFQMNTQYKKGNEAMKFNEFKKVFGIHFTVKMTGKMKGMKSLSTSSLCNPNCRRRAKNRKSICSHCYANAMQEMYKDLAKCLAKNSKILTEEILPSWPIIEDEIFRLEAFGDIANETQVINYFNLCHANDKTVFTLWTKNPFIIDNVIKKGYAKPENLIIGISSPFLNVRMACKYDFVDFVFTVYDFEYATSHDIKINCGNRKCIECRRCYTKHDGVIYVNEILKADAKKYYAWLAKQMKIA